MWQNLAFAFLSGAFLQLPTCVLVSNIVRCRNYHFLQNVYRNEDPGVRNQSQIKKNAHHRAKCQLGPLCKCCNNTNRTGLMRSIRIRYERCRKQVLTTILIRFLAPVTRASRYSPRNIRNIGDVCSKAPRGFQVFQCVTIRVPPSRSGVRLWLVLRWDQAPLPMWALCTFILHLLFNP